MRTRKIVAMTETTLSRTAPDAGPRRLLRITAAAAVAVVGGPLAFDLGGVLAPAIHDTAASTIAGNATANQALNTAHLVAFVLASYLLPIGAVGLAWLTYPRAPMLSAVGGLLALVGWAPFSALTALDDLAVRMTEQPGASYAPLLDRFTTDAVMTSYLLIYILAHLIAYVLLGAAMLRTRTLPRWTGWAVIASSPLTVLAFALPFSPRLIGGIAIGLLALGSVPPAYRLLTSADR